MLVGYFAKDITYKKGNTEISVQDALNDLYSKSSNNEFTNKTYTQEGLSVFNDRIIINNGGYYIDSEGTTWVNLTFTTKTKIGGTDYGGTWTILRGLPRIDSNEKKAIHDTTEKYAFFMGSVNNDIYTDSLRIFSEEYGYIPANTTVTVQFKY